MVNRRDALSLLAAGAVSTRTPSLAAQSRSNRITEIVNDLSGHGYYLVIAQWELKEGNYERAVAIIDQYRPHILSADGVKFFLAAHGNDDPNHILFYVAYESAAHYKAHVSSDSFQKYIIQEGLPLVAKRTLNNYTLL